MTYDDGSWDDIESSAEWNDADMTSYEPEPEPVAIPGVVIPATLPDEFWNARPLFKQIRESARQTLDSPDAVLGTILSRTSAMVHHDLRFDYLGGKPGSLNLFVALCSASGVGKSSGVELGQDIVPVPRYLNGESFRDGVGVGSGEGIAEIFMGMKEVETGEIHQRKTKNANAGDPVTKLVKTQVRHNVFMYVDEGQAFSKMMDRRGATLGETIRSAWVGSALGQSNASAETTRFVQRRSYSLGLTIGFQPDTAQDLLADGGPGTPQRFLWLSAYDQQFGYHEISDDAFQELPTVRLPIEDERGNPITGTIRCPMGITNELRRERYEVRTGLREVNEMDSHISLMKCKLSALLAILDGRMRANDEDWVLAGVIWQTSCKVRDFMVNHGKVKAAEDREKRMTDAVELAERTHFAALSATGTVITLAKKLVAKVRSDGPMTVGAFRRVQASKYRAAVTAAADYAVEQKWVEVSGDEVVTLGSVQP